ncbi:hypothetical protein [Fontivita pretiosa]|uniref:hypothetical protein n=1 Tax=Fontivita pretiosa TaxID=2989684 RepID=UPI003D17A5AB
MPDYRQKSAVEHAARYLNRDIGAFHEAWIIGTSPLAVAFLQAAPVGRPELPGRVGQRNARFVTEPDLDAQANVLLLFPRELVLAVDGLPGTEQVDRSQRAKLLYFKQPQTIRFLMNGLTAPRELERQASNLVEVPVKRE